MPFERFWSLQLHAVTCLHCLVGVFGAFRQLACVRAARYD
jgi:hypothetical protein